MLRKKTTSRINSETSSPEPHGTTLLFSVIFQVTVRHDLGKFIYIVIAF